MEYLLIFLASFLGSLTAILLIRYKTRNGLTKIPPAKKQAILEALEKATIKPYKPHMEVLHSPTPDEERKEEWREFVKLVEKKRQKMGVTQDFRRIK